MPIKIFVTGGTIDGLDYDSPEKAPKSHKSTIPGLLGQARATCVYSIDVLMSKDSRFITDEDRELILRKCQKSKEDRIIITHGTLTMAATAEFLGKGNLRKTIVLTGSAVPFNGRNSDASFNMGFALGAVQLLPAGVYIAMNGNIFSWDNVKKNLETGFFETEKKSG